MIITSYRTSLKIKGTVIGQVLYKSSLIVMALLRSRIILPLLRTAKIPLLKLEWIVKTSVSLKKSWSTRATSSPKSSNNNSLLSETLLKDSSFTLPTKVKCSLTLKIQRLRFIIIFRNLYRRWLKPFTIKSGIKMKIKSIPLITAS